jgi:hypothetical protein
VPTVWIAAQKSGYCLVKSDIARRPAQTQVRIPASCGCLPYIGNIQNGFLYCPAFSMLFLYRLRSTGAVWCNDVPKATSGPRGTIHITSSAVSALPPDARGLHRTFLPAERWSHLAAIGPNRQTSSVGIRSEAMSLAARCYEAIRS